MDEVYHPVSLAFLPTDGWLHDLVYGSDTFPAHYDIIANTHMTISYAINMSRAVR